MFTVWALIVLEANLNDKSEKASGTWHAELDDDKTTTADVESVFHNVSYLLNTGYKRYSIGYKRFPKKHIWHFGSIILISGIRGRAKKACGQGQESNCKYLFPLIVIIVFVPSTIAYNMYSQRYLVFGGLSLPWRRPKG